MNEKRLREILENLVSGTYGSYNLAADAILKLVEEETRELKAKLKIWEEKYPCCEGKPTCANNRTAKFVNEMLGGDDWNEKKDYLYSVVESLETEADFQKLKRKELESQLAETKEILKKIVDVDDWDGETEYHYGKDFISKAKNLLLKMEGKDE